MSGKIIKIDHNSIIKTDSGGGFSTGVSGNIAIGKGSNTVVFPTNVTFNEDQLVTFKSTITAESVFTSNPGVDIQFSTSGTTLSTAHITIKGVKQATETNDVATWENILDTDADISTNSSNISANSSDISTNSDNISTNSSDISTNSDNISTNSGDISTNSSNITTNSSDISTNSSNITTNSSNININSGNIPINSSNITTNSANIPINSGNITINSGNIPINSGNISTNSSNISTNSSNISTNSSDIASLKAGSGPGGIIGVTHTRVPFGNSSDVMTDDANFTLEESSSAMTLTVGDVSGSTVLGLIKTGAVHCFSDRRLKENIEDLDVDFFMKEVSKIVPRKYNFKGQTEVRYGFIAQDIPESLSELVVEDSKGWLSVNYLELIALIPSLCRRVKALQEIV